MTSKTRSEPDLPPRLKVETYPRPKPIIDRRDLSLIRQKMRPRNYTTGKIGNSFQSVNRRRTVDENELLDKPPEVHRNPPGKNPKA
jgi:hypothetical protein